MCECDGSVGRSVGFARGVHPAASVLSYPSIPTWRERASSQQHFLDRAARAPASFDRTPPDDRRAPPDTHAVETHRVGRRTWGSSWWRRLASWGLALFLQPLLAGLLLATIRPCSCSHSRALAGLVTAGLTDAACGGEVWVCGSMSRTRADHRAGGVNNQGVGLLIDS